MRNLLLPTIAMLLLVVPAGNLYAASAAGTGQAMVGEESFDNDPFADTEVEQVRVADPLESVNRGIFWFNDKCYFYLFKPVAKGWRTVAPEPVRVSVANFFSNLTTPIRFVNALLQLKFKAAATEFGRFFSNSTVGFLGFFDPASDNGLKKMDEDLGQTFGHYGAASGPYLVLPILGPSNLRDSIGLIGDYFLNPLSYLDEGEALAAKTFQGENDLSLDNDTYEGIKKHEIDPYLFIRNAYEQNRAAKVKK